MVSYWKPYKPTLWGRSKERSRRAQRRKRGYKKKWSHEELFGAMCFSIKSSINEKIRQKGFMRSLQEQTERLYSDSAQSSKEVTFEQIDQHLSDLAQSKNITLGQLTGRYCAT